MASSLHVWTVTASHAICVCVCVCVCVRACVCVCVQTAQFFLFVHHIECQYNYVWRGLNLAVFNLAYKGTWLVMM